MKSRGIALFATAGLLLASVAGPASAAPVAHAEADAGPAKVKPKTTFLTGGHCGVNYTEQKSYGWISLESVRFDSDTCDYAIAGYSSKDPSFARRILIEWIDHDGKVVDTDVTPWVCDSLAFDQIKEPGDKKLIDLDYVRFYKQALPCR